MTNESRLFGVTIRGWIAVILVFAVCIMSLLRIEVKEPLYTGFLTALAFYLGSRSNMMKKDDKPIETP